MCGPVADASASKLEARTGRPALGVGVLTRTGRKSRPREEESGRATTDRLTPVSGCELAMGSTASTTQQASGHARRRHGPRLWLTGIILKYMSFSELAIINASKTPGASDAYPQAGGPGAGICGIITTIDAHPRDTPLENSAPATHAREQRAN